MDSKFNETVKAIKKKKELSGIDEGVISDALEEYLKKKSLYLGNLNESDIKTIIKDIRAELRISAGMFQQKGWKERMELLHKNDLPKLLQTHLSTKERADFYPELEKLISSLKVASILDLGCGINPIALASPEYEYYAADINADELALVEEFFKINKINGRTFICDLRKIDECDIPKAELCIILKVFDIIENKGHKLAEKILQKVNSKYFLVSFSTKTLSGKPMRKNSVGWIEHLLKRLGYSYKTIQHKNEIFYLAQKFQDNN